MAYDAKVLKVMIASPGDVANERRIARDVVHEWNAIHSQDRATVLLPIAWETHAIPSMGERAQEIINKQLVRDTDLLVGVFWTRIGTPTGAATSGTVEEVEEHLRAGKPVMLYFSTAPVRPDSVDEEQYCALKEFRESCRQRGLVEEYESIGEFREKLTRQLSQIIIQQFPAQRFKVGMDFGTSNSAVDIGFHGHPALGSAVVGILKGLPDDARQLLREAALDKNGTVLMIETMGGMSVETNERDFVERGNARSEAHWRHIVKNLVQLGFLAQRDRDGEVFSLTDQGFRVADL
jgi:hypothetical protein